MDLLLAASSGSKHKEFTRTICYYSKGNTTFIPIEESLVTSVDQPSAPGRCLVVPFILLLCPCHLRSLLFCRYIHEIATAVLLFLNKRIKLKQG
jgi:hypothetical protein